MHVGPKMEMEYLQIFTVTESTLPLEISPDHFLYLHNDKVVRARDVRIGDVLKGDTKDLVVTDTKSIHRNGLFAPATESGTIWVSGVTASSYVSLMDHNVVSPNVQVWASHTALSPLRLVCSVGNFTICQNETYSNDGYSTKLSILIKFGLHFMTLSNHFRLWILMLCAPFLMVLACVEIAFNDGSLIGMLMVGSVAILWKMNKVANKLAF